MLKILWENLNETETFGCLALHFQISTSNPDCTYRQESVQMPRQRSLPSQTRLPLLPTLLQSLVSKPSGCGLQPSPPGPPAKGERRREGREGPTKRKVLEKEENRTNKYEITSGKTPRIFALGYILIVCRYAVITYHIFVVITVIVRLSCVGVTVSDQILHGTAKGTRHCGQTGHILTSSSVFLYSVQWVLFNSFAPYLLRNTQKLLFGTYACHSVWATAGLWLPCLI